MQRIGIIANPSLEKAQQVLNPLREWLLQRGKTVYWDVDTAKMATGQTLGSIQRSALVLNSDLIIVLGGDGTLLSVAHLPGVERVPILGVNLGTLGFLVEVNLDELYRALRKLLDGEYKIDERLMLAVCISRDGREVAEYVALNEIAVNRAALARIISLKTWVDEVYVNTFRADGLIVSTPTGSTAYSLSSQGPIVQPTTQALLITPICPHTLTNRPLVIPAKAVVKVLLSAQQDDTVYLTVDGQIGVSLQHNDRLEIKKAAQTIKLVQPAERDYYQILRTKLGWGF